MSERVFCNLSLDVRTHILAGLAESLDGSKRGRVVTGRMHELHRRYLQQFLGMLPGLLVTAGYDEDRAFAAKGDFLRKLAADVDRWQGQDFRKKLSKARRRLHFI